MRCLVNIGWRFAAAATIRGAAEPADCHPSAGAAGSPSVFRRDRRSRRCGPEHPAHPAAMRSTPRREKLFRPEHDSGDGAAGIDELLVPVDQRPHGPELVPIGQRILWRQRQRRDVDLFGPGSSPSGKTNLEHHKNAAPAGQDHRRPCVDLRRRGSLIGAPGCDVRVSADVSLLVVAACWLP
jgi:hypothetical protein